MCNLKEWVIGVWAHKYKYINHDLQWSLPFTIFICIDLFLKIKSRRGQGGAGVKRNVSYTILDMCVQDLWDNWELGG